MSHGEVKGLFGATANRRDHPFW